MSGTERTVKQKIRLLKAAGIAVPHCPECGKPLRPNWVTVDRKIGQSAPKAGEVHPWGGADRKVLAAVDLGEQFGNNTRESAEVFFGHWGYDGVFCKLRCGEEFGLAA